MIDRPCPQGSHWDDAAGRCRADSQGSVAVSPPAVPVSPVAARPIPHGEPSRCDSYDPGQCTWGACRLLAWVPEGWGNAQDWLARARAAGFPTGDVPASGAVVVYAGGLGYSRLGHLALVETVLPDRRFEVVEMNYVAWNRYDRRWSDLTDVAGFVFNRGVSPPGVWPGQPSPAPVSAPELETAWQRFADFWNGDTDTDFEQVSRTAESLRRLLPQ